MMRLKSLVATVMLFAALLAHADPYDWAENNSNGTNYNGNNFQWSARGGDWIDADGVAQGPKPWAEATFGATASTHEIDITALAQAWASGKMANRGVRLQIKKQPSIIVWKYHARESGNGPVLVINGQPVHAAADTCLDPSTYVSRGADKAICLPAYIRFDVPAQISSAVLRVQVASAIGTIPTTVQVFAAATPGPQTYPHEPGALAAKYPGDVGIAADPAVFAADKFDALKPSPMWTAVLNASTITDQPVDGVPPYEGGMLNCVHVAGKTNVGCGLFREFQKAGLTEPKELYIRYLIAVTPTFAATNREGGKIPGAISSYIGTPYQGGNSGARSNGRNGWSTRGYFAKPFQDAGNPLLHRTPVGGYVYHVDQATIYGDTFVPKDAGLTLEPGRWTCIEQRTKLNTINADGSGNRDGVVEMWIGDRLVYSRSNFFFTALPQTVGRGIERAWFASFSGGVLAPFVNASILMDNLVAASARIGCPVTTIVPSPQICPPGCVQEIKE